MNKIIRLCLSKYTNVNGVLNFKIEGALFIVHNLNASKAYGYHLNNISAFCNVKQTTIFLYNFTISII